MGPYFDPLIPPFHPQFWVQLENERKWGKICRILISDKTLLDEGCECKNWAWKNSRPEREKVLWGLIQFRWWKQFGLPPFPPPVFFFPSFLPVYSWSPLRPDFWFHPEFHAAQKKNRRRVVFPVLGTLRTTCARVVKPAIYLYHLRMCYALPGSDGKKKRSWFVFHVSDLSPTPSFFKPTADKWLDANCWLPSVQKSPHHPKCSLKQGFLAATFFSKRCKIRVFFGFCVWQPFSSKRLKIRVFFGGLSSYQIKGPRFKLQTDILVEMFSTGGQALIPIIKHEMNHIISFNT